MIRAVTIPNLAVQSIVSEITENHFQIFIYFFKQIKVLKEFQDTSFGYKTGHVTQMM